MVNNKGEQRPADINNPYDELEYDEDLERAIAKAAARHPSNAHKETAEPPTNVFHIPLRAILDDTDQQEPPQ